MLVFSTRNLLSCNSANATPPRFPQRDASTNALSLTPNLYGNMNHTSYGAFIKVT
jgi:hypothetical protein